MAMLPPPPPPPSQPPYGYQPYGANHSAEHPQGTTIIVLGILSLVLMLGCGPLAWVLGPVAWSMGTKALREMDANPQVTYTNRGNVTAGRICGMISTILFIIGVAAIAILVVAGAFANQA